MLLSLSSKLDVLSITFVKKYADHRAHASAVSLSNSNEWNCNPPPFIVNVLVHDVSNI